MLDIFCGSGTSLCVANELGMQAIGLEISSFNTMLSNAKIKDYDLQILELELQRLSKLLESNATTKHIKNFENALNEALSTFNAKHFPRDFKRKVALKEIDEKAYGKQKEKEFLVRYKNILQEFHIDTRLNTQKGFQKGFLEKWYMPSIKEEIMLIKNEIKKAPKHLQDILQIILSRTARSCRATTHSDLATLQEPITQSYYCKKHGRICKPLFSIEKWFNSYAKDTLKRLSEFATLKTDTKQICLNADSKNADIVALLQEQDSEFAKIVESKISESYISFFNFCLSCYIKVLLDCHTKE